MAQERRVVSQLGTRVAGTTSDPPYSHVSVDNIILGGIKPHPAAKYTLKHNVLDVACLRTVHLTPEQIQDYSSISVALALKRVQLWYNTKVKSIWSGNYSSLWEESLAEPTI